MLLDHPKDMNKEQRVKLCFKFSCSYIHKDLKFALSEINFLICRNTAVKKIQLLRPNIWKHILTSKWKSDLFKTHILLMQISPEKIMKILDGDYKNGIFKKLDFIVNITLNRLIISNFQFLECTYFITFLFFVITFIFLRFCFTA